MAQVMEQLRSDRPADVVEMARRVRLIRAEFDWSMRDLAAATGVSTATWSRIENGHKFPSDRQRERLADAAGMTTAELVGYWPSRVWPNREPKRAAA